MENNAVNDYQAARDFITELETKRPKDIKEIPEQSILAFWKAVVRIWPGNIDVDHLNRKGEAIFFFLVGVITTLVAMYIYHMVSGTSAPGLTIPLRPGTV